MGGENLYDPSEMEQFCNNHAPGLFKEVYTAIFNDSKDVPSVKRVELQKIRTVALLHNLSFYRNQVFSLYSNKILMKFLVLTSCTDGSDYCLKVPLNNRKSFLHLKFSQF